MAAKQATPVIRDDTYYCSDLVVKVESVLFRVHRAVFDQSEVFRDMFGIPPPEGSVHDGSDDEHPLVLHGYLAEDFRRLLKVILPLTFRSFIILEPEEWISVLKLSTAWNMDEVREAAIESLDEYGLEDPILRIIISKTYKIPHWFVPAINSLARRPARVDHADIERLMVLGDLPSVYNLVLKISWVRETYVGQRKPLPRASDPNNITMGPKVARRLDDHCMGDINCHYHGVETGCRGMATSGGTASDRAAHDFTCAICEIFDCEPDGTPRKEEHVDE